MTGKDLYIAMSAIDDDLLERSEVAKETQSPRFRRVPFVLIAAIIAMLLMGAAGIVRIYNLVTGFSIEQTGNRFGIDFSTSIPPVVLEDGRLWFTADGQRIDITDQIDNDTPFIYTTVNPRTKQPAYIIIGGTPENFGYAELWKNQGEICYAARFGELSSGMNVSQEEFERRVWIMPLEHLGWKWLINAFMQLEAEL